MITATTIERWEEAQQAEQTYWHSLRSDSRECLRVLAEKVDAASWVMAHLPEGLPDGDYVEIGIGPLGVGCIHALPAAKERALVGVEPLPLLPSAGLRLPGPLSAAVAACQSAGYTHVQAKGEDTGLAGGRFSFAACYNVLDHVGDPLAVLQEIHRIQRPGGKLLLGCDTVSALSLLRFHVYVKRRHPNSIGVLAHPFRFRAQQLERLVERAGYRVLASNVRRPAWCYDLFGRAHRLLLLCEKTTAREHDGVA